MDAVALGLVYGLAFNLTTLSWQSSVLVASYLGLAAVQAVFFAVLAGLLRAVKGLRSAPIAAALCWVAVEFAQARVPFGGFAWTRLGYAMIDTPLAGLLPLGGTPLVSFVVAIVGQLMAWTILSFSKRRLVTTLSVGVLCFAAGGASPLLTPPAPEGPIINVGWVQGGASGGGFYGLGEPGETTVNHAVETRKLMDRVRSGELPRPEFIVWPENGTDMDPLIEASTKGALTEAVSQAGVPILVGVPTVGPHPGERQTTDLWWTSSGPTARYDKRNLVPFGEWIPFREILLPAIPMLSVIGEQAIPGDRPGALAVVDSAGHPLTVGVALCYEIAFDATMFDAPRAGADVMVVGSNNAMFQGTAQIEQQFAITRVRAAEMQRQVLVVTTSGVSGLIDERGRVTFQAPEHVPASGVVSLTRTTALSPEVRAGWLLEYAVTALAIVCLGAAVVGRRRATPSSSGPSAQRKARTS